MNDLLIINIIFIKFHKKFDYLTFEKHTIFVFLKREPVSLYNKAQFSFKILYRTTLYLNMEGED